MSPFLAELRSALGSHWRAQLISTLRRGAFSREPRVITSVRLVAAPILYASFEAAGSSRAASYTFSAATSLATLRFAWGMHEQRKIERRIEELAEADGDASVLCVAEFEQSRELYRRRALRELGLR